MKRGRGCSFQYSVWPCTLCFTLHTHALQFAGGLVLLLVGGRLLVSASVDTAKRLRVSPLVVGLTLVAWGTSAPELALNLISAFKGRGDLALGNVVGANICNMALVLGVCAIIKPLVVQERLIKIEIWLNAAILGFMALLGLAWGFQKWEAGAMLGVFGAYSLWTIMSALRQTDAATTPAAADTLGDDPTREKGTMGWLMIGAWYRASLGRACGDCGRHYRLDRHHAARDGHRRHGCPQRSDGPGDG